MKKLLLMLCIVGVLSACSDGREGKMFSLPVATEGDRELVKIFRQEMREKGIEGATVALPDGAQGTLHFDDTATWKFFFMRQTAQHKA